MKQNVFRVALLFQVFGFIAGCQPQVQIYDVTEYVWPEKITYDWLANGSAIAGVSPNRQLILEDNLREAIQRCLAEKGWTLEESGHPKIYVRYLLGAESRHQVDQMGVTSVAGQTFEVPVKVRKIRSGQLAIDMFDAYSGHIIWRGVTWGTREDTPTPKELAQTAQRGVEAVLKRLP